MGTHNSVPSSSKWWKISVRKKPAETQSKWLSLLLIRGRHITNGVLLSSFTNGIIREREHRSCLFLTAGKGSHRAQPCAWAASLAFLAGKYGPHQSQVWIHSKETKRMWKASSPERFSPHFSQSEQMHTPILLNYHLPIIFVIASSKRLFSPPTN